MMAMAAATQIWAGDFRRAGVGDQPALTKTRLDVLFAEMEALMRMLPVNRLSADGITDVGRVEDVACCEEDVIDAGFDNLPL